MWNSSCADCSGDWRFIDRLINDYDLSINNDISISTWPKSTPGLYIIDLTWMTAEIGYAASWIIDPEYYTLSDHEPIVLDLENLDQIIGTQGVSKYVTRWGISSMTTNRIKGAERHWMDLSNRHDLLTEICTIEDLVKKAE